MFCPTDYLQIKMVYAFTSDGFEVSVPISQSRFQTSFASILPIKLLMLHGACLSVCFVFAVTYCGFECVLCALVSEYVCINEFVCICVCLVVHVWCLVVCMFVKWVCICLLSVGVCV